MIIARDIKFLMKLSHFLTPPPLFGFSETPRQRREHSRVNGQRRGKLKNARLNLMPKKMLADVLLLGMRDTVHVHVRVRCDALNSCTTGEINPRDCNQSEL